MQDLHVIWPSSLGDCCERTHTRFPSFSSSCLATRVGPACSICERPSAFDHQLLPPSGIFLGSKSVKGGPISFSTLVCCHLVFNFFYYNLVCGRCNANAMRWDWEIFWVSRWLGIGYYGISRVHAALGSAPSFFFFSFIFLERKDVVRQACFTARHHLLTRPLVSGILIIPLTTLTSLDLRNTKNRVHSPSPLIT